MKSTMAPQAVRHETHLLCQHAKLEEVLEARDVVGLSVAVCDGHQSVSTPMPTSQDEHGKALGPHCTSSSSDYICTKKEDLYFV